jgi:hypothetical protein
MIRPPKPMPTALAALALAAAGGAAATPATPEPPPGRACFLSNNWDGWNAAAGGDVIYLRVRINDVYKVELTPGSHVRKDADKFLINRIRGSSWICSPMDLDLALSDHHGFRQGLIARSLRKLTPAEIAAIPRKELP